MESPPPLSCYISQTSKKRVFPGSSSTWMEADVVEIQPPPSPSPANRSSKSKSHKQNTVDFPEIIDVDMDEDCADIMLVDVEVDTNGKGKEIFGTCALGSSSGTNDGSTNSLLLSSEKNNASTSDYLINGDDLDPDLYYGENEYMDMFHDDYRYDENYAIVQAHLDSLNIPPGVEVNVPWFTGYQENKMKSAVASTSTHSPLPIDLDAVGFHPHSDSSSSTVPLEFEQSNENLTSGGTTFGTKLKSISYSKMVETSSSLSLEDPARVRKRSNFAGHTNRLPSKKPPVDSVNFSSKTELFKSHHRSAEPWARKMKRNFWYSDKFSSLMNPLDKGASTDVASSNQIKMHDIVQPEAVIPKFVWQNMPKNATSHSHPGVPYAYIDQSVPLPFFPDEMAFSPWDMDPLKGQKTATAAGNSSGSLSGKENYGDPNEFLKNFDSFKRFDTVQDCKDHHYYRHGSSSKQPSKNWAKKIQEEWRILENDLPDTIYVRVYESRMDLLRAAIIGAEGTPYHDGLFFFDVFFPVNYPNVPPLVYYHSGGLRINPNLYHCGKVCLSLLNTWGGSPNEKWMPGVSTILQVLVSIQGLILNAKPFFNEPGYANLSGSVGGEKSSLQYNENTFIFSLKTMVYSIRRPPKYFEDLVAGHFFKRAHDILVACKAYIGGAQVGCLVKGGVQDVDEGDKSCSQQFKNTLAGYMKTLVDAFAVIGVKDCDEFLSLAQKTNGQVSDMPVIANHYY